MSETEGKMRTRSQTNSKKGSRDSSRERPKSSKARDEAHSSRAVVSAKDKEKIKGILKTEKSKEPSEGGYSSAAESSAADSDSDGGYLTADIEKDQEGGILSTLKNLQYGTHVALRGKGKKSTLKADRLIKADSNQNLIAALKQERLKGAEIYAALIEGGGPVSDPDIPQFKPFNKKRPPCPPEEFEKQLRTLQRNYTRFEGRCAEFIYFLMDILSMKNTFNITDEQLAQILQNRLGGRLQKYFMIQMKRSGDVVTVLNRMGKNYVETIDTAAEIEKCATFKFQFKNVKDELIKLQEMLAMAYPRASDDELRQIYIQKVTDKVPADIRLALAEDFQKQSQRVDLGMPPLTDSEIDARIIKYCKPLERRQHRPVFKVKARPSPSYEDSVVSEDSISVVSRGKEADQSLIEGFVRSVQQIVETAKESNDVSHNHHGENSPSPSHERSKGKDFHPHNNGGGRRPPWQKRGDLYEQPRGGGTV